MYENFNDPLASREKYHSRVFKAGSVAFVIFIFALSLGILGFRFLVRLAWINSFLNASMMLGGIGGEISEFKTDEGKIFAGCFALFSGVTFLSSMAIFLSPIVHRFIHKFHIDIKSSK